ncbi:ABC transporter permease [Modestobacter sp. I12A-02628]|uniref:ABC transporter permease n=1 Tax=Goekera deserti TaxID=2497753 RepID=A0A7K3WBA4_9ACTN|nr:ABC transporter permease [Goekera deserti]MPQ98795.1 ABC transporter permease [Goekera deserti]NDI49707.1 ABC transporter permease [Goekera deserti]NEL53100.1 ABC transporter permease [Goekera deserti]
MTATLTTPTDQRGPSRASRVRALATAETRLLLRNRTAVVNSVLLPLLLVAAIPFLGIGEDIAGFGPTLVISGAAVALVFLVYYNTVTTFVARREDLTLQRMRTGELTGLEVLVATAAPSVLIALGQVLLTGVGVLAIGRWEAPTEYVLPLVALFAGAVLVVLLGAVSTAFTRTPESAQVTTFPFVMIALLLSGLMIPLASMPDQLAQVARLLPMTPVVELLRLGLAGQAWDGATVDAAGAWAAGLQPLGVLVAWLLLGSLAARRWFRWAPRR